MSNSMNYTIYGDDMQMVEVKLQPGETIHAEAGMMMFMETGIEMQTTTGSGGLLGGLKRMVTGESFFITTFENKGSSPAQVGFSAPYPGKIISLDLGQHGGTFLCQKDSYLCSASEIGIEVAFTKKLGAGLFGGEGFILQRLTGDGLAFLHSGGTIIEKNLAAGERLRVDTGCLVAFAPSVDYDIEMVGGFKNALFGGEGLFLASLTGPGLVFLQTLPFSRMADRILAAAKGGSKEQSGTSIDPASIIGSFFGK